MLNYIKKDITTVDYGIIIHGCNAQGVMGSGVALALRNKYPQIFEPYKQMCDSTPNKQSLLEKFAIVYISENLYVVNLITQVNYGRDGQKYANLDAIVNGIDDVMNFCKCRNVLSISIPKIGGGLGGLDWDSEIAPVLEELSNERPNIEFNVCEL
jgi:O-acetyl-ADP-ribose deacetylase (regulator of RNase III)